MIFHIFLSVLECVTFDTVLQNVPLGLSIPKDLESARYIRINTLRAQLAPNRAGAAEIPHPPTDQAGRRAISVSVRSCCYVLRYQQYRKELL
jgi:hypothetical protein